MLIQMRVVYGVVFYLLTKIPVLAGKEAWCLADFMHQSLGIIWPCSAPAEV
jgi:hypothetical protein